MVLAFKFHLPVTLQSFYKKPFYYTTKGKKAMELFNFITANNQELGNRFHSFTAKTRFDTFITLLSFLYFYSQVLAKIKGKIPNFDVSLCLCHIVVLYVQ